ncbi:hypothetical protein ACTL6U_05945 [Rhodovibrionaceae bacterium A322]
MFLLLLAFLATAFWGLFAYQNLTLIFGLESLAHFLPAEQAFLAVAVVSPVLFIWTFVAWRRSRRQLHRLEMSLRSDSQRLAMENEENYFQGYEEESYESQPEAQPPQQQAFQAEETDDPETPLERHRYREEANAARARVAPSIDLPKPLDDEAEQQRSDPYGYAGKEERTLAGEGGAPPSVLGGKVSLDDLIREKEEQDAREANKWEIDPEHPFADNVPSNKPEPAKVSLADVIAEERAEERAIEQQATFHSSSETDEVRQAPAQQATPQRSHASAAPAPIVTEQETASRQETVGQQERAVQQQATEALSPAAPSEPAAAHPAPAQDSAVTQDEAEVAVHRDQPTAASAVRVPPPAPVLSPVSVEEEPDPIRAEDLKLPPHPFEVEASQPKSLSAEQMANLERRVRGELNSIAMDLASVISAPERYDHAFQHYNGGAEDAFFQLVSQDLVRGQGPQMNQQLKLLGGEAMLKSFVEKYQHLLSTAKLSDPSGQTTHRLSHSGMGEVCRALLESQQQDAAH